MIVLQLIICILDDHNIVQIHSNLIPMRPKRLLQPRLAPLQPFNLISKIVPFCVTSSRHDCNCYYTHFPAYKEFTSNKHNIVQLTTSVYKYSSSAIPCLNGYTITSAFSVFLVLPLTPSTPSSSLT